jgi:glycosyltransferase involved in cell wall biosynthesis
MKILFINHHHLNSNSGIHIFNLANQLTLLGVDCMVCVPDQKDAVKTLGTPLFKVFEIKDFRINKPSFRIDFIHAWTPREIVRRMTLELVETYNCPYIVHLEDNEEALVKAATGLSVFSLTRLPIEQLDKIIQPHMTHPLRYKGFLDGASGFTLLLDKLHEFCSPGIPHTVFWPGYEEDIDWHLPCNSKFKQQLGIGSDEHVVAYTGNVHSANRKELFSLYLAVGILNRRGIRTKLVRTGHDFVPLVEEPLEIINDYCVNLGHVQRKELPTVLSIADVLVQPGRADEFNNYRFPSKLPEYFATGKPVVLPATNIGRYLRDGEECILLYEGHALDIATHLEMLFKDPKLREKIGEGGKRFAKKNLRWSDSALKLQEFYHRLQDGNNFGPSFPLPKRHVVASNPFKNLKKVNAKTEFIGKTIPILSYGTVKDYCDSADRFPNIMRFDGDLKDLQRPWMVKSILQMIPRGAKLLEIGGGEPLASSFLQKCGFDVTVIDPYDGTGNGPQDYKKYKRDYPDLKLIKSFFTQDTPSLIPKSYECIFSISVLEHVQHLELPDTFSGIKNYLKPGGCSIHCVDLVAAGRMAEWHEKSARDILFYQRKLQNPKAEDSQILLEVDHLIAAFFLKLKDDVETFYLSAQGHNLWRGDIPYDEYPFQKIISMQTCAFISR